MLTRVLSGFGKLFRTNHLKDTETTNTEDDVQGPSSVIAFQGDEFESGVFACAKAALLQEMRLTIGGMPDDTAFRRWLSTFWDDKRQVADVIERHNRFVMQFHSRIDSFWDRLAVQLGQRPAGHM